MIDASIPTLECYFYSFIFYYYFIIITILADGFSVESEQQQIFSRLQDSYQYSGQS